MNVETPSQLDQSRTKEMDHPATMRDVYPALDQRRVCLTITVFDDPIT
jgi:hypothetical protein